MWLQHYGLDRTRSLCVQNEAIAFGLPSHIPYHSTVIIMLDVLGMMGLIICTLLTFIL